MAALKPAIDSLATRLESKDAKYSMQLPSRQSLYASNEQTVNHAHESTYVKIAHSSLAGGGVNSTQASVVEGLSDPSWSNIAEAFHLDGEDFENGFTPVKDDSRSLSLQCRSLDR